MKVEFKKKLGSVVSVSLIIIVISFMNLNSSRAEEGDSTNLEVVEVENGYLVIDKKTGEQLICNFDPNSEELMDSETESEEVSEKVFTDSLASNFKEKSTEEKRLEQANQVNNPLVFPYSSVCMLMNFYGTGDKPREVLKTFGTGFLLSSPAGNVVVTAGHNVVDSSGNMVSPPIFIFPGFSPDFGVNYPPLGRLVSKYYCGQ